MILLRAFALRRELGGSWQLSEVLVGQDQAHAVAAGFGEHVVHRAGQVQEVVALVDEYGAVASFVFGQSRAGGGGLPGAGQHEGAHQSGGVLAELAFGEAGEQDAAVVEQFPHVE